MPIRRVISNILAGRAEELTYLGTALTELPLAVFVGGEAGVGKSRLVREFLSRVQDPDDEVPSARVLIGACLEVGAAGLPFAPFNAALRQLVRQVGVDGITAMLPGGLPGGLARLLPEFGEPDPNTGMTEARLRLFDELVLLFERLAEDTPVILVIEDAHWADRSTRDLLSYLTRNLPPGMFLLVTYRSDDVHRGHPLRSLLVELDRGGWAHRLALGRLPRRAVAEQVRGILGRDLEPLLFDRVYERSDGNPLFVEALLSDGQVLGELPESLRDLLLGSVHKLPEETQEILRVASAAGDRVEHALLVAVTGLDDARMTRALRPAVAANVLLVDGDGYAFRHTLMREVVHDDLLPGEHTRTHIRYAEALEKDPTLVSEVRTAAALSHHWYAAHDIVGALTSSWKAARDAKEATAYAECLRMLDRVLELWERVPDAADRLGTDHVAVLEMAVGACDLGGEPERGVAFAREALKELDDPIRAAGVLIQSGRLKSRLSGGSDLDDLREAVRLVPAEPPSPQRARVLGILAQSLYTLPFGREEGRALAVEALEMAREVGDRSVEAHAMVTIAGCDYGEGDAEKHLAALAEAEEVSQRGADDPVRLRVAINEANVLEGIGEHERALAAARRGIDLAGRQGQARTSGTFLAMNLAEPLLGLGRWDEVLEVVDYTHELSPPTRTRNVMRWLRAVVALARGDLTEPAQALTILERMVRPGVAPNQEVFPTKWLGIALRLAEGDVAGALDAVEDVMAELDPSVNSRYGWPLLTISARACAEAGDDRAASLLGKIQEHAARTSIGGPLQEAHALVFRAEIARAEGASEQLLWDEAAAAWDVLSEPYPQTYALLRAAESADRDEAAGRLRRAAELADRLGAHPLLAEIEATARRARIPLASRTGDGMFGLTPRECEVLHLVAEGRSNREIAGRLFISAKTASAHVSNILAKLEVTSRGEAAATAHRLGMA